MAHKRTITRNIFTIFSGATRFAIMMKLHLRGEQTYEELRTVFKELSISNQTTMLSFELKVLKTNHLIYKGRYGHYHLSDTGRNALDLAIQLSKVHKYIEDTEDYDDVPASVKLLPQ